MLEQWFDLSKKISKTDLELATDQMLLYAVKDGLNPNSKAVKQEIREFETKVRDHNKKLQLEQQAKHNAEKTMQVKPIPIFSDDGHCDPQCPYLMPGADTSNVFGKCRLTGKELDWYDWFLAACDEANG